jgi:phosphocarrier protein FPr
MSASLHLLAPLSGAVVPIERVPDPVFAQKLVGDGVGLDPISQSLKAPCDGQVTMVHSASHAVTLSVAGGLELLLHIGLDTVTLRGRGFTARVTPGDRVMAGDSLIDFDADFVATHARSLISMMVITNPDRVKSMTARSGIVVAGQDVILELELAQSPEATALNGTAPITSTALSIADADGLHARPAAVLTSAARRYVADIWMCRGDKRANARSVTALMSLDVRHGDEVTLQAHGPDAQAAIDCLSELI